ncbi:MAG: twin-arginine translocation signal domain-containing protein, partial [Anaerolineae bacterium]
MISRRDFLKLTAAAGAGLFLPAIRGGRASAVRRALAASAAPGLSDPALQPKFHVYAPNALAPSFKFSPNPKGQYSVAIRETSSHMTGLIDPKSGRALKTTIWGYADERGATWPGRTFEVQSSLNGGYPEETTVKWANELFGKKHLLPVDTNLHWAYSLPGYDTYT